MPEILRRNRVLRLFALVSLATMLSSVVVAVVAPAPAEAAVTCVPPANRPNGEGAGWIADASAPLRSAPYSICSTVMTLEKYTVIYYHCWVLNDYNNFWVYGRVANTSTYGWMYLGNIYDLEYDDNGDGVETTKWCS